VRVQAVPTHCPRCEALGSFRPRRRPVDLRLHSGEIVDDICIEVFIRCPVCHYEQVLRVSTPEIEDLRRIQMRLEAANRYTTVKHGVPSSVMSVQVRKVRERIRELEREIPR
jgi:hypothetical protein